MLPYVNAILSKHGYSEREVGEGVQQQSYNVQNSLLGTQFATGPPRLGWSIHVCAMPDSEERRYGHDPGELRWPKQYAVANHILRMASTTPKAPKANLAI